MKYYVSIPIKGTSTFEVSAASEGEAIEAAWRAIDKGKDGEVTWEYFEDQRTGDTVEAVPDRAAQSEGEAR